MRDVKEERREKMGEGEKETHYQVTRAPKGDPALLHQRDEAVLVQLEASKEHSSHSLSHLYSLFLAPDNSTAIRLGCVAVLGRVCSSGIVLSDPSFCAPASPR